MIGPLVVALDIGSSSVRAGLFDSRGRLVRGRFVQRTYPMSVDSHGGVTIQASLLLDVVSATLDEFVAQARDDLGSAVAVGTSCFLHSIAALDAQGRPVTTILSWADTTSASQAAALRAELSEPELWQITGCPVRAGYWPARILQLGATAEAPIARWVGASEIVFEALTGSRAIDLSMASGTGLLDRAAGTWHGPLLDRLGLDPSILPELAAGPVSAGLCGWAAARWPALAGIPWLAPWSDASCGNLGLGGVAGGPAALMIGTSGAMRVVVDKPAPRLPGGLFGHRLADGTGLVGGQLSEGGAVVASVARLLRRSPAALDVEAAETEPDGHGLTILPYLAGERGPGYHDEARGVVAGLDLATRPGALYRAFLEAVALRFAAIDARLAAVRGAPPRVVAGGGALARSPLWVRIVAAALGRDIELAAFGEASSRGAALVALSAVGAIRALDAVPPPPTSTISPDPAWVKAYRIAAERQEALYRNHLEGQIPERAREPV